MNQTTDRSDRELVLTRMINAPREQVFAAWTDPAKLNMWWGPHGFHTTTHEMDFRTGGHWRFTMHGPDGTDYPNLIRYTDIRTPEHLYYDQSDGKPQPDIAFKVEVSLSEEGSATCVTLRMICESAEQAEMMRKFGAIEGGTQTLERLQGLFFEG
jgi:uncharacterized protein YndB with AHSA1/START domain